VPGDCGLLARFIKAETLLVLTLWRIYHDARMEQAVEAVVVTAKRYLAATETLFRTD
jgi:hypothetical protein